MTRNRGVCGYRNKNPSDTFVSEGFFDFCRSDFSYSVRSATTGSFFAAMREGISPAINVRNMLISTSTTAATGGSAADMPDIPERAHYRVYRYRQEHSHKDSDNSGGESENYGFGVEHAGNIALRRTDRAKDTDFLRALEHRDVCDYSDHY